MARDVPTDSAGAQAPGGPGEPGLLWEFATLPAVEAARQIEHLLAAVDPEGDATLDANLLHLLADRHTGDAMLAEISLDRLEALAARLAGRLSDSSPQGQAEAWQMLDVVRRPTLLRRIAEANHTDLWADRILELVDRSHFTMARLFEQRCQGYGSRPLFRVATEDREHVLTWHQVAGRVDLLARGLLAVTDGTDQPRVAILSDNAIEMALVDLACLTGGIVNVMIPANATDGDVAYILEHSGVDVVALSGRSQLQKIEHAGEHASGIRTVIAFDAETAGSRGVMSLEEVLSKAGGTSREALAARRARLRVNDLATIMYTSGTTGTPKGICFSHRNLVFKRFARALALPELGEHDRLLCYLPLYHTFGRFLEMIGCVFWGATYCFAPSTAIDSLIRQMARVQPTVFISIPLRWMQLYDAIRSHVDVEVASDVEIEAAVQSVTGGELRWGLSAAGYLDPEIFRFFQRHGVELMSGFGMTEATGGITMTPPGDYHDDSLGVPLPGIEVRLDDDGELMVRGPYVMIGYLDPPDGAGSFDEDGWLRTGDLMERGADGHLRIIDRKKEIYKNVKGQTIAPQKIENLFRDFDSVGSIFLVGDHREYNTALVYPNWQEDELDLRAMGPRDLKTHFRSLVVSANSFLAPYERIVDFAIVDRDFDAAQGELTPKGTYRRKAIERNFADTIRLLYRRTTLEVGKVPVTVPNWLFQALGVTAQELQVDGDLLRLPSVASSLTIRRLTDDEVQVGSVRYRVDHTTLDLGLLLSTPRLWLGNQELFAFAPLTEDLRDRRRSSAGGITWLSRIGQHEAADADRAGAQAALNSSHVDLLGLHRAALLVNSSSSDEALIGVQLLEQALAVDEAPLAEQALLILRRAAASPSPLVLRRAFQVLAVAEQPQLYRTTLARFLDRSATVLNSETVALLSERDLSRDQLTAFIAETERRCLQPPSSPESASASVLLDFLAAFGTAHPSRYRWLRAFLTRMATTIDGEALRAAAAQARSRLEHGFRSWLGQPSSIAVDPETGREFRWEDVVAFSEEIDDEARDRMLDAIRGTTMLREAVFLFSHGSVVRLEDILPQGVWIRLLGTDHGKSVFRVAVKTRQQEQHDLAINLNRSLSPDQVREEIDWLIVCSEPGEPGPLVEEFGGHWPEHQLWTEEFIPGETLDRALRRLAGRRRDQEWFTSIWPFAAWSALSAYVDFWNRSGRRLVIADPTPGNVIVPMHDYHTGARLVSISSREPFDSVTAMLRSFHSELVLKIEAEHPVLEHGAGWEVVFSALLEIVGEAEGFDILSDVRNDPSASEFADRLSSYLASVERRGFLPKRLYFAAKRFRRWQRLNPDATQFARVTTLSEMYRTYRLDELQSQYPDVRPRFFRETVFREAPEPLAQGLDQIVDALRRRQLDTDHLSAAVADLRARLTLDDSDDEFMARLCYPYLRPEDEAAFVASEAGGSQQSEMVVTLSDRDGRPYHIRHALTPKEVARLHRLFLTASLPVQFRPEHRFLVAVSDRGHLIGGLFYELQPDEHTAHMDKVVVAEAFQGHGVGGALIEELCNRLRAEGYTSLTTGFFRPQFFYRCGFSVERRYAGLVRPLGSSGEGDRS